MEQNFGRLKEVAPWKSCPPKDVSNLLGRAVGEGEELCDSEGGNISMYLPSPRQTWWPVREFRIYLSIT